MDPETLADRLPDPERARTRRRDRRRRTGMVVDNGGIKRVQLALATRRQQRSTPEDTDRGVG
jgi:hypothetical protein